MPFLFRLPILIALIALLSSCAAIIPHTLMTPMVRHKGAAEIIASAGLHGFGLQAAYAPTNRTVLLASGHQWARGGRWSLSGEVGGGRQWVQPNSGSWALYGGVGYGNGYSYDNFCLDICDDAPSAERVRYTYAFIQPSYTLLLGSTSLGFAVRAQPLRLSRWETYSRRYSSLDSLGYHSEYYLLNRRGHWLTLLQPGINVRQQVGRHFCLTTSLSAFLPVKSDAPTVLRLAGGVGVQIIFGDKL